MSRAASILLLCVALTAAFPSTAVPQSVLDRVVGRTLGDWPVLISAFNGVTISWLSIATGVPMGFEERTSVVVLKQPIEATGKTLRSVLDALVRANPGYEWRETDGVVVLRPQSAWDDPADALMTRVEAVALNDATPTDALLLIARMFGSTSAGRGQGVPDTKRFSIDVPAGSTALDVLNAVVREHGSLTWVVRRNAPDVVSPTRWRFEVSLLRGNGDSISLPEIAVATGFGFNASTASASSIPLLDRVVAPRYWDGGTLILRGVSDIHQLASATGVPMGIEIPSREKLPRLPSSEFEGFPVTGLRLRDALLLLTSLDPRFEWREMDGVIVFRPTAAWEDVENRLFKQATTIRLDDAAPTDVLKRVIAQFGWHEPHFVLEDTRHMSVDFPAGTLLDLLNAVVRSHGEMTWQWEEASIEDRRDLKCKYWLEFSVLKARSGRGCVP